MSEDQGNLGGRIRRYARVGSKVGGVAMRVAGARLAGRDPNHEKVANDLRLALGGLKGPLMKVAQILSTIPEFAPPEYAAQLSELQTNAPPMGWAFVRRRMKTELGPDWLSKFEDFEREAAAAASLGQVHRAKHPNGTSLACKLQYPDMLSAVEADLSQLRLIISLYRRIDTAIDPTEMAAEIGARLREELDYTREAAHIRLYSTSLQAFPYIRIPEVVDELSTRRLLTMSWLNGRRILDFTSDTLEVRNQLAKALFQAWWHPLSSLAVIHGDPHLGNYTVFEEQGAYGVNLLDFGCIRIFPPHFVKGVIDLYTGILNNNRDQIVSAYEIWGFQNLSNELIDTLNIWARFIYGPLLDDRVRTIADGVTPAEYGRREAFEVHKQLRIHGPVTLPREFVFMDRAAIGLGAVFLHLGAEMNFYRLFNEAIENFEIEAVTKRQAQALESARVPTTELE